MRVLVLYASKLGGTEGIAQQVGEAFGERGIAVEVAAVADTQSLAGYDAVVIGSGLYAARWRRRARRFVRRHVEALQGMPVWFFSSGPLDASATEHDIPPVAQVDSLMQCVGARGHATFGGRLAPDAKGFPASAMAKKNAGDWRDAQQIWRWANQIADELMSTSMTMTRPRTP
jgi:menaquinone-dependent protoporphyrinogen oxidase